MTGNRASKLRRLEKIRNLMEEGLTQSEIANRLGVSLKTVNSDFKNIKMTLSDEKRDAISRMEELSQIQKLPPVAIEKVTENDVEDAILDVMKAIFLEFKRRLPVISNEEIIKAAMSFYKLDDRI